MYSVSAAYKTAISDDVINDKIHGTITLSNNSVINISSENKDIYDGTLYITESCCAGENLDIGSVNASELGLSLTVNPDNPYSLDGARVSLQYGLEVGADTWEYVPLGVFYVTEISRHVGGGVTLKALDGMVLLDNDISGVLNSGTPYTLISSLCQKCGVTLATATTEFNNFVNSSILLTVPDDSGITTCRDLLMWVCQTLGAFGRFDRNGELEIVPVTSKPKARTISFFEQYKTDVSDYYVKITKVSSTQSVGGDGMELSLEKNPLWEDKSDSEVVAMLNSILAQVTTAEYTPLKVDFVGDPSLQVGDFVGIEKTAEGESVTAYITKSTWYFGGKHTITASGESALLKQKYSQSSKSAAAVETVLKATREIAKAVNQSTQILNDTIGGNVLIRKESDTTNEILIMDNPDPAQAKKIWRWNMGGLGYSDNVTGADSPERVYSTAITMDGSVVANFIDVGVLNGALLQADSVSSSAISTAYKSEITNEIGQAVQTLEQSFVAGNAQLQSIISDVRAVLSENIDTLSATVSTMQQTINDLSLTFSTRLIGGENLLQNSSAQNGVSDDWSYTGTVFASADTDVVANTSAKSAFKIFEGELTQSVDVIAGCSYTISLKVKSYANRSYAYIDNGGKAEYIYDIDTSIEWTTYTRTITASAAKITLVIGSNGDILTDNTYIADMILVAGETPSNWSPAANEIYTTNIKFDRRGLRVTNTDSDTETIIDNTQFAVLHKGETVITVNKDLTLLKKAQVDDVMTVGKLRFVPRDDGVDCVLLD